MCGAGLLCSLDRALPLDGATARVLTASLHCIAKLTSCVEEWGDGGTELQAFLFPATELVAMEPE